MTGKVINLRRARKQKTRAEARVEAGERAARFGEAKADCNLRKQEAERAARDLDGKRRT